MSLRPMTAALDIAVPWQTHVCSHNVISDVQEHCGVGSNIGRAVGKGVCQILWVVLLHALKNLRKINGVPRPGVSMLHPLGVLRTRRQI